MTGASRRFRAVERGHAVSVNVAALGALVDDHLVEDFLREAVGGGGHLFCRVCAATCASRATTSNLEICSQSRPMARLLFLCLLVPVRGGAYLLATSAHTDASNVQSLQAAT